MIFHAVITPIISAILSERTRSEDQGYILGINQSYISMGQIVGPLTAGYISRISETHIFVWAAVLMYCGFLFIQFSKSKAKLVNV